MKRLIFILTLFFSAVGAGAQTTYSCAGSGALSSNWTNTSASGYSALVRSSGACVPTGGSGTIGLAIYTGTTFTNDQYAQAPFNGTYGTNSSTGPCVHMDSAGNGYCWIVGPNLVYKLSGGSGVGGVGNCGSIVISSGDTLRLSVQSNNFTCADITTGQTSGAGTDSSYPSGSPGAESDQRFHTDNNFTSFQAGNFTALAVSPNVILPGSTGNVITLTGTNTPWTTGTPGSPTFTLTNNGSTAATLVSQSVASATSATVTVNAGGASGSFFITDPSTGNTATVQVVNPYTATSLDCSGGCTGTQNVTFSSATTAGQGLFVMYSGNSAVSSITVNGPSGKPYYFNIACGSSNDYANRYIGDGVVWAVVEFLLQAPSVTTVQFNIPTGVTFNGHIVALTANENAVDVLNSCASISQPLGTYSSVSAGYATQAANNELLIGIVTGYPNPPTITGNLPTVIQSYSDAMFMSGLVTSTGTYSLGATFASGSGRPSVAMIGLLRNNTYLPNVPVPIFNYTGGTYGISSLPVKIHDAMPDASIYISTTGTATCSSTPYTDNTVINVTASETISATACKTGYNQSGVMSETFNIIAPTARQTVYIRPDGGSRYSPAFTSGQCNGLVDAAYPGTGTNRPCAFNQYQYICDDTTPGGYSNNCMFNAGDRIIVEGCNDTLEPDHACEIGFIDATANGPWYNGGPDGRGAATTEPVPSGLPIGSITNCSITAGVATVTVANTLSVGDRIMPDYLGPCAQLNGILLVVTSATSTQFQANVVLPDLPDVTSAAESGTLFRPTEILGSNYAACATANHIVDETKVATLFGVFAVLDTYNAAEHHHVVMECLELTSVAVCVNGGDSTHPPTPYRCQYSVTPVDNFDSNGMLTYVNTDSLFMRNIWIHHHTARAVKGPLGGVVTCYGCMIEANGAAGWDFDPGDSTAPNEFNLQGLGATNNGTASVNATWNFIYSQIWTSGCNVSGYQATTIVSCYDQNGGGYGDAVGSPPGSSVNAFLDHAAFVLNVQDGLDIGHEDAGGSGAGYLDQTYTYEKVFNSYGFGNMGSPFKAGPNNSPVDWYNVILINNCQRMAAGGLAGFSSTYNQYLSAFCRASTSVSMNSKPGVVQLVTHMTDITYWATSWGELCWGGSWLCPGASLDVSNSIFFGIQDSLPPLNQNYGGNNGGVGGYCFGAQNCYNSPATFTTFTRHYNLYYGIRNVGCPTTGFTGEKCGDVLFTGETPAWTCLVSGGSGCTFTELTLDGTLSQTTSAAWLLSASSPAKCFGTTLTVPSTDFFGHPWCSPNPSMGAAEFVGTVAIPRISASRVRLSNLKVMK